jgi:arylsulfatase
MVITQGGLFAGWALFFNNGKPVFHYNTANVAHYHIAAPKALAPGTHHIRFDFAYDGGGIGKGGTGTLLVDGNPVAKGRIEKTIPIRVTLDEGLDIGEDTGTPVATTYDVPFKFTGKIEKVTINVMPVSAVAQADVDRLTEQEWAMRALHD